MVEAREKDDFQECLTVIIHPAGAAAQRPPRLHIVCLVRKISNVCTYLGAMIQATVVHIMDDLVIKKQVIVKACTRNCRIKGVESWLSIDGSYLPLSVLAAFSADSQSNTLTPARTNRLKPESSAIIAWSRLARGLKGTFGST